MKRHQLALAPGIRPADERGEAASVSQTQTVFNKRARRGPASSEASFVPISVSARTHTLILTGELDRRSAHALEAEIERLCEEGVTGITLDLRELEYIDSTGVAVIAFRCGLCQRRGYDFALVRGSRLIHRAFEQAGVADLLPFEARVVPEPPELVLARRPQEVASIEG